MQRKKRTHVVDTEDPSKKGQPKSFVLRRGRHAVRFDEKNITKILNSEFNLYRGVLSGSMEALLVLIDCLWHAGSAQRFRKGCAESNGP